MLLKTVALKFNKLSLLSGIARTMTSNATQLKFETLKVTSPIEFVYHVELNRPEKYNAMNKAFWREMIECFQVINEDSNCRVAVLSGAGKVFTSGLDLTDIGDMTEIHSSDDDIARKTKKLYPIIKLYQNSFTAIEKCNKPVIVAIHNACIGGGVDLISACDIRICSSDAWFQIKEVDLGMAADVGTLQRLPKVIGNDSLVRELVYTARKFFADEAARLGMVSRVFPTREELMQGAFDMAKMIAEKSPVAVQGSKVNLNYSRDHTVEESLDFMAHWNKTMLLSSDLLTASMALMTKSKDPPIFAKY